MKEYLRTIYGDYSVYTINQIEILQFKPTKKHNYHILITNGLRRNPFQVGQHLVHFEFMMKFPCDWKKVGWEHQLLFCIVSQVLDKNELFGLGEIATYDNLVGLNSISVLFYSPTGMKKEEYRFYSNDSNHFLINVNVLFPEEVDAINKVGFDSFVIEHPIVLQNQLISLERVNYVTDYEEKWIKNERTALLKLSHKKLKPFSKPYFFRFYQNRRIKNMLLTGDANPAVVISIKPFIIACYSFEFDCVVTLKFNDQLAELYQLDVKSKLITIHHYSKRVKQIDIQYGDAASSTFTSLYPIVADFLTNYIHRLNYLKSLFSDDLYSYIYELGIDYLKKNEHPLRDGNPFHSMNSNLQFKIIETEYE